PPRWRRRFLPPHPRDGEGDRRRRWRGDRSLSQSVRRATATAFALSPLHQIRWSPFPSFGQGGKVADRLYDLRIGAAADGEAHVGGGDFKAFVALAGLAAGGVGGDDAVAAGPDRQGRDRRLHARVRADRRIGDGMAGDELVEAPDIVVAPVAREGGGEGHDLGDELRPQLRRLAGVDAAEAPAD